MNGRSASSAPTGPEWADPRALRAWQMLAGLALVFTGAVGLMMLISHLQAREHDPWRSPQMLALKAQLRAHSQDERLKEQIRALDWEFRQRYFRHLTRQRTGAWLLLAGGAMFVLAAVQVARFRARLPQPSPEPDAATRILRERQRARRAVAVGAVVVVLVLGAVALGTRPPLPRQPAEWERIFGALTGGVAMATASVPDAACLEELHRNWPRFRGADGSGVAHEQKPPTAWDESTGAGILWKTPVPIRGFNSPLVWEDAVLFSGGDAQLREVVCIDAHSGAMRWRQAITNVPGSPARQPDIPEMTGFAAATMATDGRRAYVIFANGDLAALTLAGQIVWAKNLGVPKNPYGHASSLATWGDQLLVLLDQGEPEDRLSRLLALDGRTGRIVWEKRRPVGASWATPIIIAVADRPQIITLGLPWVIAYAAADGAEIWRGNWLLGEITPSPVYAGGRLFVVSPLERLEAVRPDGQGDVTATHLLWQVPEGAPDIPSPVSDGELVFTVSGGGLLGCFDARDGTKQWEQDLGTEMHASPALADGRLYLFGVNGTVVVAAAGREYQELFRTRMADSFHASPAFVHQRIYVRGETNLYCLGTQ